MNTQYCEEVLIEKKERVGNWIEIRVGCVLIQINRGRFYSLVDKAGKIFRFVAKTTAVYVLLKYVLHI